MRYAIVCLLKGDVAALHGRLLKDISVEFDVKGAIEREPPSHFSLKYPFDAEDISEIEIAARNIARSYRRASFRIEGFSSFGTEAVFMDIKPSKNMNEIFIAFIDELKNIRWMQWDKYDGNNLHFHITIACDDVTKEKYSRIMRYLNKYEIKRRAYLDNITIMKLKDDKWIIHKSYPLLQS